MSLHKQLSAIYDIFNEELFENILGEKIENTLITLQRKNGYLGYMQPDRFASNEEQPKLSEIALNIEYFGFWPRIHLLQNLVHQMMHCYQHQHGEVTKLGAHDEQFQDFMLAIGLQTSDTGTPGGKPLGGRKVFNYPLMDGAFVEVCNEIADKGLLPEWFELEMPKGYGLKSIMEAMYRSKEQLPESINPVLLEVPFFKLSNIDTSALIESIEVDEKSEVFIDKGKAFDLAEKAIVEKRAAVETPMQAPTHKAYQPSVEAKPEYSEEILDKRKRFSSTFEDPLDETNGNDSSQTLEVRMPGRHDFVEDDGSGANSDPEEYEYPVSDDFESENDDAAKFLKAKEKQLNKDLPKKPSNFDSPVVVQSIDQMASILGLSSADAPKPPEKKKSKFKYTCSCGNEIWGTLSLSVICGKCQLHFQCETIKKETGIVFDD